jgi:PiT family inorganic phosphate transporter
MTFLLIFTIFIALAFDFMNGFHDAANSIATIVSTRVLKPHWAVLWAAFFNFSAVFFFGVHVANTLATGLIDPSIIDIKLILAALLGAISWNILTWIYGLPSSSSHSLIGGLLGAGMMKSGIAAIEFAGLNKIVIAIVLSPLLGFVLGLLLMYVTTRLFYRATPRRVDKLFRILQLLSSALISLGHGGNDAQKTMGIIAILLFSSGQLGANFYVPTWVIISCYLIIALGTCCGGWRIVKTMGMKITKLQPIGGFCSETASAVTISLATSLGIPVSTTHTVTGAIIGVGSLHRLAAVRWGLARNIVWAWLLTIPASGLVAAIIWWSFSLFF